MIYRSYLWIICAFAALPFLCQKLSTKQAAISLTFVALFLMPLSWLRLTTFSHPLLLWDDAARLVENTEETRLGIERIFYNRGSELIKVKYYTRHSAPNQLINALNCEYQLRTLETGIERGLTLQQLQLGPFRPHSGYG